MNRLITSAAGLALIAAPLAVTSAATATADASDAFAGPSARQAPSYSVKAKINMSMAIAKEDTVKIRGKVSPKAAGDKVVLQQRVGAKKSWSVSSKAKIKANGSFLLKDDPSATGTRFYRVLKPGSGKIAKGVSKELELVVYGWEKLGYRSRGPAGNVSVTNATVATETFPASIVTGTPGTPASIEYTLGKKCLTLRSTYALTDSSATGGTGTAALKIDGNVAFASGLVLGQSLKDVQTNISGAFRISYELVSSAAPDSYVTAATPEVLCTK